MFAHLPHSHPFSVLVERASLRARVATKTFTGYIHSHYYMVQIMLTLRCLVVGYFLSQMKHSRILPELISMTNTLGLVMLSTGIFGVFVSLPWVKNFWLNLAFSAMVFCCFFFRASMFICNGILNEPYLYLNVIDIVGASWLFYRLLGSKYNVYSS